MAFDDLLVQRGTLRSGIVTRSDTGEPHVTWTVVDDGIPVLVRPASARADLRMGLAEEVTNIIFSRAIIQIAADVSAQWQLVVDGREYIVVDPSDAANRGHHWETRARRET